MTALPGTFSFSSAEYERIIKIIEEMSNEGKRLFCSAVYHYQLAMGARIEDTSKLLQTNLKHNADLTLQKLSLISKLCWSKNVMEEKDGT